MSSSSNTNTKAVAYLSMADIMEGHKNEKSEKKARKLERAHRKASRKIRKLEKKLKVIKAPEPQAAAAAVVEEKAEPPPVGVVEPQASNVDSDEWSDVSGENEETIEEIRAWMVTELDDVYMHVKAREDDPETEGVDNGYGELDLFLRMYRELKTQAALRMAYFNQLNTNLTKVLVDLQLDTAEPYFDLVYGISDAVMDMFRATSDDMLTHVKRNDHTSLGLVDEARVFVLRTVFLYLRRRLQEKEVDGDHASFKCVVFVGKIASMVMRLFTKWDLLSAQFSNKAQEAEQAIQFRNEAISKRHRAIFNSIDVASQDPQAGALDNNDEDIDLPDF